MSESQLDAQAHDATLPGPEASHDEDDRLSPQFVRAVIDRVEAGDEEGARALIEPLHPADVADLFELADRDERRLLARAVGGELDG